MIYELEYFIDGEQIFPDGWELIGLQGDYTESYNDIRLTVDSLDFSGDSKSIVQAKIDQDGDQVAIECLAIVGTIEIPFVLKPNEGAIYTDDAITMPIEQRGSLEWLMARLNSKTWVQLNDETAITGGFDAFFVIKEADVNAKLATLAVTELTSIMALIDKVRALANAIAQIVGGVGGVLVSVSMVIIEAAHTALLIIVLVKNTKAIFELFFPKIRKLRANTWRSLMQQALASEGYTLSSTLMDRYGNASIVPVPMQVGNLSIWDIALGDSIQYYNNDFPAALDSIPFCGDIISEAIAWLRGEPKIVGNVFYLESEDFWDAARSQTIESTLNNQDARINEYAFNTDESWKTKTLAYQTDIADRNTLDNIKGLNAGYRTAYTGSAPDELVDITGTEIINSVFSLGKRKTGLTYFEIQVSVSARVIDEVINEIGFPSSLNSLVIASVGTLQLSSQHFARTKLLWMVGGRQTVNYLDNISAKSIYTENHTVDQVKENYSRIEIMDIPFSPQQFFQFNLNNRIFGSDGSKLEALRYSWITGSVEMNIETAEKVPELSQTQTILDYG